MTCSHLRRRQYGDAAEIEKLFQEFLSDSISIRDTCVQKDRKENFYHGILLGLLQAEGSWIVRSNIEAGTGYTDIQIEVPTENIGCIIEVKYAENGTFDTACAAAMEQIDACGYTQMLHKKEMKTIHKYGIACYKKCCKVVYGRE